MPKNKKAKSKTKGLYKRSGSDFFYADLGRDTRGHRMRRSTGTADLQRAQEKYELWLFEENLKRINPSKFAEKVPYPFPMAVKAQAEWLIEKNEQAFLRSGRYRLRTLLEYFADMSCHKIGMREINAFIRKRSGEGLSKGTIKRDISVLSAVLNRAYENEFIDNKPRFPSLKGSEPTDRILSKAEEKRLLEHAPTHLKEIIVFALETGARKSEILSLDWRNVDIKNRRIKFVKTKNGKNRIIPMTNRCYHLLSNKDRHIAGAVFGFDGIPIKDIKSSYGTAKTKAGISGLTFHDLRHTFASRFIMRGGPQQALMTMLGHSSPAMTQRYTHLSADYLSEAMKVMNSENRFGNGKIQKY